MLLRLHSRCAHHGGSRCFLTGPGDVVKHVTTVLRGLDVERQGSQVLKDGFNGVFKNLGVPLELSESTSRTSLYQDMSESGLRKRLETLKTETELIQKYLEEGLAPSTPSFPVVGEPDKVATPSPQENQLKGSVLDAEEGEEYVEQDSLTRRLKKWYTIESTTEVPYQMMATFELYPQWIPWCQSGRVLLSHPVKGVTKAAVGFGIKVPFMGVLGDDIEYRVELEPPPEPHGASRVYTISDQSRYMQRLVYDWRFIPLDNFRTKVVLEVEFKGAAHWCMPIWEGLRRDVINNISKAFTDRVVALQASAGGDRGRPALRPKLASLTSVLQGPFLRDQAVVVTESNGRTIRHANAAFAALAGRSLDFIPGKDIPDLLQDTGTDRDVLRGMSAAVKARLPATAVVRNKNKAGKEFLNRLSLAPLDDDESDTGVVFWAVLKVVHGMDQSLEFSTPDALDEAWGPDYEHPDAIFGKDMLTDSSTRSNSISHAQ